MSIRILKLLKRNRGYYKIGNINYKFSVDHNLNDFNYNNVSTLLNFGKVQFNLDYLEQLYDIDDIIYLSKQWEGDKPKDNVVIGSDFSLTNKKNNLRVKSSIAISLYNENIWDGGITNSQVDALDGYEDCYIGRTYNQAGQDLLVEGSYWLDCQAYMPYLISKL